MLFSSVSPTVIKIERTDSEGTRRSRRQPCRTKPTRATPVTEATWQLHAQPAVFRRKKAARRRLLETGRRRKRQPVPCALEAVADADVGAAVLAAGDCGHAAGARGRTEVGTALVVDDRTRHVQSRALGQRVHVAERVHLA